MLRVTYTGGDAPQHWLFDPDDVTVTEGEHIEAAMGAGQSYDDFVRGLIDRKVRARRVLLWHLLRRDHGAGSLMFSDVPDFKMGQMTIDMGTAELTVLRQQIEDNDRIPPERKNRAIAAVEEELALAAIAEADAEGTAAAGFESDPKDAPDGPPDPVPPAVSTVPRLSAKSGRSTSTNSPRSAPRRRT